jgi:hypothetical protein
MGTEEEKEEKRGFKVEDRRRFSDTGEARAGVAESVTEPAAASAPAADAASVAAAEADRHDSPPLEMNFSTLVLSLSTQALAHLGEIPDPAHMKVAIDLPAAKHMIDILGILQDKTKGNLEKSEAGLLDSVLYDLRLKYVERVRGS